MLKFQDQSLQNVFEALGKVAGVNVLFDPDFRDKRVGLDDILLKLARTADGNETGHLSDRPARGCCRPDLSTRRAAARRRRALQRAAVTVLERGGYEELLPPTFEYEDERYVALVGKEIDLPLTGRRILKRARRVTLKVSLVFVDAAGVRLRVWQVDAAAYCLLFDGANRYVSTDEER